MIESKIKSLYWANYGLWSICLYFFLIQPPFRWQGKKRGIFFILGENWRHHDFSLKFLTLEKSFWHRAFVSITYWIVAMHTSSMQFFLRHCLPTFLASFRVLIKVVKNNSSFILKGNSSVSSQDSIIATQYFAILISVKIRQFVICMH